MRISLLRQRMVGDMCVRNLAAFIGRPPETATPKSCGCTAFIVTALGHAA